MPRLALLLLLAVFAAPAHALGLGAAQLQSWFGQPLKITIPLLDEGSTPPDIGCFSISSTEASGMEPPSDAALHLNAAGNALVITSRRPAQSLALEFAIAADCHKSRVTRRYSLLMDPPPAIAPVVTESAPAATISTVAPARAATAAQQQRARASASAAAARHARPMARKPRTVARRPARAARPGRAPRHAAVSQQRPEGPHLSLSGGSGIPLGSGNLALQLDTTLTQNLPAPPATPTPANMEAQAAALRQTLNGLQKELDQLRKQNAELQARLDTPPPPPPAPKRNSSYGWIVVALSLLLAAAALAWALHRRHQVQRAQPLPDWETPSPPLPALKIAMPSVEAGGEWCELPAAMPPPPTAETGAEAAAGSAPHADRPPPAKRPASHDAEAYPFHGRRGRDTGTEVNESAVDRAEVFLAFGHADLAIHLLEEHLAENPTESPVPWLLLLELLEREGLKKQYQEARLSCKVHFNLQVADLDESTGSHSLEDFPHILAEVKRRWNSADIASYLDGLLRDDRGGMRRGFDPGTFRDILFLRQLVEVA